MIFGGWIQDSYNKRTILLCSSAGAVVLYLCTALLVTVHLFNFSSAVVIAFLMGLRSGLAGNVSNMMLRSFIPAKLLPKAISVNGVRDSTIGFAGEPVGGVLLQLGKSVPYFSAV